MKKTTYYVWSLTLIGIVIACVVYPQTSIEIPIHWNSQGIVDGYAPTWTIFLLPLVVPLLDLFLLGCRRIDPKWANYQRFESTFEIIRMMMANFSFLFFMAVILEIFYPGLLDIRVLPLCVVGILISTLGNLFPKIKPNYFIGIRTPWTLMNETVWIKTHRIGGRAWFIGGFLFFLTALAPKSIADMMMFIITIIILVYPVLYSYIIYRKCVQKGEKND